METRLDSWLPTPYWHGSLIDPPELRSTPVRKVAVFARVASSENKDNLERQAERLISWYNAQGCGVSQVVKGCGSGINDQRPKFLALFADPKIGQIVVEHKDRVSRFGVAYIQTLLAGPRTELVVVNTADTAEDDLMGDAHERVSSESLMKHSIQAVLGEKMGDHELQALVNRRD